MDSILPQLLVNGFIAGAIYALAACGFSLVYYVLKFQYFSHGGIISLAAYAFFASLSVYGMNYIFAAITAIALSALFALASNFLVYKPLRKRKSTSLVLLISSIVLLMLFSSLILAVFGSSTKSIPIEKNRTHDFGIFTMTSLDIFIIFSSLILFAALWLLLKKTRLGTAMRALSDNKDAAKISGINPEKIYTYTFLISAVLATIAGILIGMEQNLYPRMGIPIIVKGFIGTVIGGIGSVPGSIIGGFFLGIAENLGIWKIPSAYKDVISFAILLIFLLLRPQGILGMRMRDDS